jgi:dihydroorotate dehydrogenase
VPVCERCHDCFFQWDDVINDLRQRIARLHSQTISLTQFYFDNYTVDEIVVEINQLLADLQQANESINTINLQESSLEQLQQIIINVSLFHKIATIITSLILFL